MEESPIAILSPPSHPIATEKQEAVLHIVGTAKLAGHVPISGAKNSALALMAGALLSSEGCTIANLPCLVDVQRMEEILVSLGVRVQREDGRIHLDTSCLSSAQAPYELVSQMRASFFIIGPLLSRLGIAQIPLPGGCAIGARPVDLHVKGLQAMGAEVEISHGIVHASSPRGRLQGAKIYLDYPSVGATETIMMAATLAEGETVIQNAAQEPEVVDLANFCRTLGAKIYGAGSKTIVIVGVPQLHGGEYTVIPDRIEAGTYMIAGAITRSEITLSPVIPEHLGALIAKLREIGVTVTIEGANLIRVQGRGGKYRGVEVETSPFPGFPTDMQAQLMALLTISEGNSVITETVFENRLQHVAELCRMGANIRTKGNVAIVTGVKSLSGAPVMATDLRASAALVLAGLAAEGETQLRGLHHLDRGYDRIEEKLRGLGATLYRV
ncbi:MAG: UDP-N-acetylglucosamine 1-carboxyvinyltransferase [Pseudanabaenaceae cyanobacterium SKYGB_i_bin29]|nr:UDP-N-acetylglucosamine 1-carboxyvinyltransferase [Pseudanabaenaceae cyanobacterium SKYG29]MDW8421979.1 UDP-N-acetylglucosamine 1-carboxyvinyltransferase [Pseudanabaenaceae cyanobacterium SKYGB_i_bin29]